MKASKHKPIWRVQSATIEMLLASAGMSVFAAACGDDDDEALTQAPRY